MDDKTHINKRVEQILNKLNDLCDMLSDGHKIGLKIEFNLAPDADGRWKVSRFDAYERVKRS